MKNPFKPGDRVTYIGDCFNVYTVYHVYDKTHVSLGLLDYPDVEQDYQVNVCHIKLWRPLNVQKS